MKLHFTIRGNNMPKVSVIIPTYNRAHLIGRAIKSVINQTYQDFEIIVVDDGSTDNTEEIVKSFNDPRIRYIRHEKNKGEAAARNTGIEAAKGKYIAFQDSDDEWFPEKLEKQMKIFEGASSRLGIVYTSMYRIDKEGRKHDFKTPTIMPEDGLVYRRALDYQVLNIGIGTAVVRRTCFNTAGMFDEQLQYFVDLEFFIRSAKHFYFYHINEPLINYYEAEGSLGGDPKALAVARKLILEKYFKDIEKDKKVLSKHYFSIGVNLCLNNNFKEGRNYLIKAVKTYPLNIKFLLVTFLSLFGQDMYNKIVKVYRKIRGI